jgi:CDP-glucose 4,6-dehydratase
MRNCFNGVYKGKRVLVIGHTGFSGSWLTLWLGELGAKVTGYSLEPPTEPNLFENIELEKKIDSHIIGDVRSYECLGSVLKDYRPEIVFHLAAQPLVKFSYREPRLTYETNVIGTVNVLEAVRKTNCVEVCVVVTSDKCYENKERILGYKETDPVGGHDPYSSSKGCAELVTAAYRKSFFSHRENGETHRVAVSSVRAGNMIGGGDWGNDRIIPDCIRALSEGKTVVIRNPKAIRPWQYVLEALSGYLWLGALMHQEGERYSGAWNFGPQDDEILLVEDITKLAIKHWGMGDYFVEHSIHPHEATLLKLDCSKVHTALRWTPAYDVHTAVKKTIMWYKEFYGFGDKGRIYSTCLNHLACYIENARQKKIEWSMR